jgi:hypothetical protein
MCIMELCVTRILVNLSEYIYIYPIHNYFIIYSMTTSGTGVGAARSLFKILVGPEPQSDSAPAPLQPWR